MSTLPTFPTVLFRPFAGETDFPLMADLINTFNRATHSPMHMDVPRWPAITPTWKTAT